MRSIGLGELGTRGLGRREFRSREELRGVGIREWGCAGLVAAIWGCARLGYAGWAVGGRLRRAEMCARDARDWDARLESCGWSGIRSDETDCAKLAVCGRV